MKQFSEINIDDIEANAFQPRTIFEEDAINSLASSIKENGLIQPITVKKTFLGYELIAGERRLRACKSLGMKTIPAIIITSNDVESAQIALIENIQRENLSVIEEAKAYKQLLKLTDYTQQQLAQKLGKTQANIANKLRLLSLSQPVIEALENKQITERHGRAMLSLDEKQQEKLLNNIVTKNLNVAQTEQIAEKISHPKKKNQSRCFGVSNRIIINTIRETYKNVKSISEDITLDESETDDSYIMTFTIKK